MNTNNSSQTGHIPSEQIFADSTYPSNIDQMLSIELVTTTSQSWVQFNTANMIPSQTQFIPTVQQQNNLTIRHEGRRRRRQRQRQRRRQQRQLEEQQRRQIERQQLQERQRRREQIEGQQPTTFQPSRILINHALDHDYWESLGFPDYMDEIYDDPLIEAYEWEKIGPKERWEHEQLNEFEGFAALEQLLLMQDEMEQENQINTMMKIVEEDEKQEEVNQEQFIQLQLWEHAAF